MNGLSDIQLEALLKKRTTHCVSIYMPTYQVGKETEQNPIRFKNLLTEAEEKLVQAGCSTTEIDQLLSSGQQLLEDYDFWQQQAEGLAVFLTAEETYIFKLPRNFKTLCVVNDRFHIKPLLPLLNKTGKFFILALSLGAVKLFEGSLGGIREIEVDLPKGIADALSHDDPERQLQHQTLSRTGDGRPAIFHGHGDNYDNKQTIRRYFQHVDKQLQTVLHDQQAPMVVACVDYLLPIYTEANTYNHLVRERIGGNPDELNSNELHTQAWKIVEPIFEQAQKEAIANYHDVSKTELGTTDIRTIVSAAYFKRLKTLFVATDEQKWGCFDPDTNSLEIESEASIENDELLDFAAAHTLMNNGKVFALESDQVPGDTGTAAILRY
ncbi:MAG: hypothetical protein JXB38_13330 [Anaerolineales bacterium]|nr:hypothetical protein [Anaerolineales bacterium]